MALQCVAMKCFPHVVKHLCPHRLAAEHNWDWRRDASDLALVDHSLFDLCEIN